MSYGIPRLEEQGHFVKGSFHFDEDELVFSHHANSFSMNNLLLLLFFLVVKVLLELDNAVLHGIDVLEYIIEKRYHHEF